MCFPLLIPIAIAVVSAMAEKKSEADSAKRQQAALGVQRTQQAGEIQAQASTQAGERVKAARAERSRLAVAAGEAGVGGVSVGDQMFNTVINQSQDVATIGSEAAHADAASAARYQSGLAGAQGPTALETGLSIASAGYTAYSGAKDRQARKI